MNPTFPKTIANWKTPLSDEVIRHRPRGDPGDGEREDEEDHGREEQGLGAGEAGGGDRNLHGGDDQRREGDVDEKPGEPPGGPGIHDLCGDGDVAGGDQQHQDEDLVGGDQEISGHTVHGWEAPSCFIKVGSDGSWVLLMDEVFLPAGIYPGSMPEKPFYLATSALIRDGSGKVLLLKRAADDPINRRSGISPEGRSIPVRPLIAPLRREAREETGMRITLRHVAGAGELDLPTKRIAYLIMICDADGTEVDLSPEHEDYAWVDPGEAMAMDLSEQFRGLFLRREDILR